MGRFAHPLQFYFVFLPFRGWNALAVYSPAIYSLSQLAISPAALIVSSQIWSMKSSGSFWWRGIVSLAARALEPSKLT
jgi:hypothetical protein